MTQNITVWPAADRGKGKFTTSGWGVLAERPPVEDALHPVPGFPGWELQK